MAEATSLFWTIGTSYFNFLASSAIFGGVSILCYILGCYLISIFIRSIMSVIYGYQNINPISQKAHGYASKSTHMSKSRTIKNSSNRKGN